MNAEIQDLLVLLQMICVIIVAAYFITRTGIFTEVLERRLSIRNRVYLILFFGILSIYGTLSGVEVLGAPINVRDLGPMVAGIFCGPVVGLGAGLIGGAFRMGMGGFTAASCSLSTVLAGLLGGAIYYAHRGRPVAVKTAVGFAAGMEVLHMGIVLLLAQPFDQALSLVNQVALPMILANAAGMFIFAQLIANLLAERRTKAERDSYHDELQRKKAELQIAADIQQTFLPKSIPPLKGFDLFAVSCPAREVGGDFYDAIRLRPDHTGLVIADVSGKSVSAALYMALSRTIIRAMASWHPEVSLALADANTMIEEQSDSGMFVTLFYGVLSEKNRTLTYANAGHNPPLLLRAGSNDFVRLMPTGVALGAASDQAYGEAQVTILPGDLLVLYTDGVTEAINSKDEEFSEAKLMETILRVRGRPSQEIIREIRDGIREHAGEEPQFDDITLMVLKGV
ncbi:protein serine/threonine phosphatase [Methanofollis liminatans DSM 4140]|uniref:Protein serine/threonine phosphatase n=1 Tax=Methanofollis liminatans DSM 4140 TaxID=28892 RepID=J1L3T1_9EURY|nr:SpoIIE family protein phosphatase [Methanofollis liminatans]EJG07355.1 protein serine/threonine phosphatase [Methanofollis liminatans DSM 4140]